jgi:hypothetical protein
MNRGADQFPRIDIRLASGLLLPDSVRMLVTKFRIWGWDLYDGVPVLDPFRIMDDDVDTSFTGIKMRTPATRPVFKASVRNVEAEVARYLGAIPCDVTLENGGLGLEALCPSGKAA